ncbi:MAG: hypothetical protein GVY18_02570, partial [Bacteroidetes bacterium]|nr:hypothetical protein [Bacteroidota bacterium]
MNALPSAPGCSAGDPSSTSGAAMRSLPHLSPYALPVLVCLFIVVPGLTQTVHAQVAAQDRAALIALYEATTVNEPWFQEYGFSQAAADDDTNDVPVSEWRTSEPLEIVNGRVVYVDLFANNLNGTLPDELCDLDQLRALDLGANKLEGPIPSCIGAMTALTELDIAGQDMSGTLPESLLDLENLEILDLAHNDLTGSIPSSLGDALSRLVELKLGPNQFAGSIPPSLGNLTDLRVLDLDGNDLTGMIPPSLGDLANLETLVLRENQLSGAIPASLGGLTNLIRLDLASTRLTGTIPATLGGLSNLQYLLLMANDLTDFEPGSYAGWANLRAFYVGGNELSELPDLSAASGITEIQVSSNLLSFADLEPLVALNPSDFFFYDPQRTLLEVRQTVEDGIVVLSVEEDGSATTYQWERWDPDASAYVEVEGATDRSYAPAEQGSYQCRLTNPLLPELTLRSYPVRLEGTVIVVNSAGDAEDDNTGDDACDTGETVTGSDGQEAPECTLRAALQTVNASGSDVPPRIAFDIPGEGVPTIAPGRDLPAIQRPVTIDGTTQGAGSVLLQGDDRGNGLVVRTSGSGSTVKGLIVSGFTVGIRLRDAKNVSVEGNAIVGNAAGVGIGGFESSSENVVRDNVIGNNKIGVLIAGAAIENIITDNYIGTERDGRSPLENDIGVWIVRGEKARPVGNILRSNVISANREQGVVLEESGINTLIESNMIGVDHTGTQPLPNGKEGIRLKQAGGFVLVRSNVVAGNLGAGVRMDDVGPVYLIGNYIGTNQDGQTGLGNDDAGILAFNTWNTILIGNVIAANFDSGLRLSTTTPCRIEGNWIGTDPLGRVLGNGTHGILLEASNCIIGGDNTIAHQPEAGIFLRDVDAGTISGNNVVANLTGLKVLEGGSSSVAFNSFRDNYRHVDVIESEDLIFWHNEFTGGQGANTGLHLTSSSATIEGNQITDDVGDAITLEDGSTATVTGNNIFGNGGMGLSNRTPSVVVPATGNWWGDASGPGGEGPGSGDAVSAGVDYADWRDAMVDVVVSAPRDEIVLPIGETDTVAVFVQNWVRRDDVM